MAKRALIFPGQGAQYIGMAKDIAENSESARKMISNAEEIMGIPISEYMFSGPVDVLKQTDITQPAIYLHSLLLFQLMEDFEFDCAAGHSLGEYSALSACGALSFENGLKIVRERGKAMLQAGIDNPGTMAAVIGLDPSQIEDVCSKASEKGIVQPANFNSPGQIVISGSVEGVQEAMKLAKESGAKLVKELVVSGAFHSPLMESAKEKLKAVLDETEIKNAAKPVYTNVSAKAVSFNEDIKELLYKQVTSPVRWQEIIENMINDGVEEFYEIGPGKVLQGLVKKIDSGKSIIGLEKFSDLEKIK